jgi:hypothetical protein
MGQEAIRAMLYVVAVMWCVKFEGKGDVWCGGEHCSGT